MQRAASGMEPLPPRFAGDSSLTSHLRRNSLAITWSGLPQAGHLPPSTRPVSERLSTHCRRVAHWTCSTKARSPVSGSRTKGTPAPGGVPGQLSRSSIRHEPFLVTVACGVFHRRCVAGRTKLLTRQQAGLNEPRLYSTSCSGEPRGIPTVP